MSDMPDRALLDWLEAGPDQGPQHGLERALAATRRTTQRPRWSVPRSWIAGATGVGGTGAHDGRPMILRFALVLAIVAVSVTTGLGLIARNAGVGGPGGPTPLLPSPSASPSPSSSPSDTPSPGYGSAPPGWIVPQPLVPASPLADPAGEPLPDTLVGRAYNTDPLDTQGMQALVLTLRAADDPHCVAMFGGRSTCFTVLWTPNYPKHVSDKAVRGSARIVDGALVLGFSLVPDDPGCEGTSSTYSISPDGWTLRGTDVPACSFQGFTRH